MMNNLQKDLQENVEKYNGKHYLHKKVKVINCYHCYPISAEANIPDNFIRFWDWITIFHSAKSCTSLILFYFDKVIKARAGRNRNAIISNISELCQTIIFDLIPIEIDKVGNSIQQINPKKQKILFLIHIRFLKIYLTIHFHQNLMIINNKLNHLKRVRNLIHQKKIHQIVKIVNLN